jgi:TolA-binding protein
MSRLHLFKTFSLATFILIGLAACADGPSTMIFNEAEEHLSRGEYTEAINKHTELINKYPASPKAPESLFKKGHIYYRYLNKVDLALRSYDELSYLYPESPKLIDATKEKGKIYSALGEHWKAVKEYEWLLEKAGEEDGETYQYLIGMEYFKMNDFRQARIEFAEIIQKKSGTQLLPEIHFRIATSYYLEENLVESLKNYKLVVELFPEHPLAIESSMEIAQVLADAGKFTEAIEWLKDLKVNIAQADRELVEQIEMRIALITERMKRPRQRGRRQRR